MRLQGMKNITLIFLSILLVGTLQVHAGDVRKSSNVGYSFGNSVSFSGRRLSDGIISTLYVDHQNQCILESTKHQESVSMNVAVERENGKYKCELSKMDQFISPSSFTSDAKYLHYSPKTMCMIENTCKNDGRCIPNYSTGSYTCQCSVDFKGEHCEKSVFTKLNENNVCFGAKDSTYGAFIVKQSITLTKIKLVHKSGSLRCDLSDSYNSNFGCANHPSVSFKDIAVCVTDSSNTRIYPAPQDTSFPLFPWYQLSGYNSRSSELVLELSTPYSVTANQELRVWYGEDLYKYFETDNTGTTCIDIYSWEA